MTDENIELLPAGNDEGETLSPKPRQRKKGRARVMVGSIMLSVIITASIVGSYGWRDSLRVKRVFVEGCQIVPAEEIVQRAKVKFGMSLYAVDLDAVRENILSQHYIMLANVVRELPDALRITVQERLPIAATVNERIMYLDEEGMVLSPYEGAMIDVPFIRGVEHVPVTEGTRVADRQLLQALELLKLARSLAVGSEVYHLISEVHVPPGGEMVLYSSDAGVRILFGRTDALKKLHLLKTFWDQFVNERGADRLRLVDLRFEDQVIARWDDSEQQRRVRK